MQYAPIPTLGPGTVYIYGLTDPETDEIRYIGKSIRPTERVNNHMNEKSNCHRSHWLQSLKAKGQWPGLVILEMISGAWPWQHSERHWIAHGRKMGWRLTNNTSGGDGVPDLPPETRAKMAAVWKGRKHSPETIEKLRLISGSRTHSDETRAKMSKAHKGRKMTWGDKLSQLTLSLTEDQVSDIKDALANGAKVKDIASQYGRHRGTITKIKMGRYHGKRT